jgi:hypothetical protein
VNRLNYKIVTYMLCHCSIHLKRALKRANNVGVRDQIQAWQLQYKL